MNFKRPIQSYSRALAAIFFVLLTAGCATMYNPATEQRELILISTDQEVSMGQDIHAQILKEYKLLDDRRMVDRVARIGQRLATVSDRQDYEYHFYLIDKNELNAFTVPGGSVYLYSGLLEKLSSDDEVAGVLAHEIGHCAARHTVKKFQAALGYNVIGSIVFSQIGSESARQIAAMGTNSIMQIAFSAYGRRDEYQADLLGIKYMRLAGYDLNGMIKTLEVLKRESKGDGPPLILRSHPYLNDRIEAVKKEIGKYSNKPAQ